MKKILLFIALFSTLFASSQSNDTSRILQAIFGDGYQWKRGKFDSAAYFPLDTFRLKKNLAGISFAPNGLPYYKSPGSDTWTLFGSGGGIGTVTGVSTSGGSPLFTTTITPGAVPNIGFTLSPSLAYTIYGNNAGSTAAPSFFTPTLASALFQNQGSTTTFLKGNAAGNPSWSAINLATDVTGVLPPANGGYINPMTTLGDIIYGGASGVQTRLGGNITAIKQVYISTGTGSAATAPTLQDASTYIPNGELLGDQIVAIGNGRDFTNAHTTATYADGIITGCVVSYVGGLTYRVNSPCVYNINGTQYSLPGSSDITLPDGTASAGEFRTDAIVVTTSSTATSVLGDNSVGGVGESAQADPSTQFLLSYVRIDEANTTPTGIGQTIIRDEGSGGEWTISKTLTSTDNYGTNPFHLTISQRITGANSGQYLQWIAPAMQSKATFTTLLLYIRNNSALANVRNLTVTLRNGNATQVGNAINLTTYGYVKSALGSYQTIAIPMSAFAGGDAFDRIRITNTQVGGTVDWQIDYVQLQSGITTGPPTSTKQVFFATVADLRAYSGTPDIVGVTLGYYTNTDGGGAKYRWDGTSIATDNGGSVLRPNSIAVGSAGRWLMIIENHTVNVKQFGAIPNGIFDNLAAFQAAYAALPRILIAFNQYSRGNLHIPISDSAYYISDSLLIDDQINIIGESEAEFPFATVKVNVASGKSGLVLKMGNPSGGSRGSYVQNIAVFGLGTSEDTTKNGIWANGLVHFENVHAENFGRSGININTTINGNANVSHCDNCSGQQNGLYGLEINGGESSQISVINPDFQFNGRSNIYDNGFLGVQIFGGHTSGAGMRSGHTSDATVSRSGNYYVAKAYNVNKDPLTETDYWENVGASIEIPGSAAAWNSGTTYHPAANLEESGDSQGGTVYGLYCEGGSGANILKGSNMAFGGQGFSTFNKIGLHLANDNNYFSAKGGSGFLAQKKTNTDVFSRLNTTYGSVEVGSVTNSGLLQLSYKDSIAGFYSANTEVFRFGFLAMNGGAPKWGLTANQLAGTPYFNKFGVGFVDVTESSDYGSLGANAVGMMAMGRTYPFSEGLRFRKGFVVWNIDISANDTLCWVANTETPGGNSAHWDRVLKSSGGSITAGYGLAGTTTLRVDTNLISSKAWLYKVADSLGTLIGGAGGISGTMVSGRIPVGSGSSSLTTYSGFTYDNSINTLAFGVGGTIRDNGSNMRFGGSGGWEFYNGTNNGSVFYDGAGADGITITGFGRTINSSSTTADLKIQNGNAAGKLGIGGTPDASAKFHVISTTLAAISYPVMTTSQRNAISSPIAGDGVYCSDCTASDASTGVVTIYNGSTWKNCW